MASEIVQSIKGYELLEMMGEGGFGAVYRAFQPLVKREVAVKVILPAFANQPAFIRRFETEAQLVARLEHLHIVPLYDYWRDPSGAFLVMRMMRGGSLQEDIQQRGAWTLEEATRLMEQIASALSIAHRGGVVHRDLKPANILLDEERNAYLSDFGIAKGPGNDGDDAGVMVGTPAYVAPEQIQGKTVTPQTDIYSLGLLIFETLTRRQAFDSTDMSQLIIEQLTHDLPSLASVRPDLPAELDDILRIATAKEPEDRYKDVTAFAKAFKQAVQGKSSASNFFLVKDDLDDLISVPDGTAFFTITPEMLEIEAPQIEVVNPYKGLRAFQEGDSSDFFGRDALTEQLIIRLCQTEGYYRFLAVVGPSGSGKSSVVKAGVIPALRRGVVPGSNRGFIVEMVPSNDAMRELEAALLRVAVNPPADLSERLRGQASGLHEMVQAILPDDESELYLYIDQFEEVYTQTEDNAIRMQFMDSLRHALTVPDSRLRVMITIRADFYDKPLLYPEFGAMIRERTEVVLPLNKEELRSAIVGPASRVAVRVEDALVQTIVNEVRDEPGALPLLQYALTEVFERRSGMVMTLDSYHASGGVLGSLARRAEELYSEMTPEQQEAVRQLFLRLVTLGEGTEDTRRRILWSELVFKTDSPEDALRVVLDRFGKYRLLTFDNDPQTREPTIEVAHEALIRQWKRLREWLVNSREDVRTHRRLTSSVLEWRNGNEDQSFLASGVRLGQFEGLLHHGDIVLTPDETRYITSSMAYRDAEQRAEEARKAREAALEKRVRRFLTALAAVLTIMAVGGFALAGVAFNERDKAEEQREIAEQERTEAETQRGLAEEQREVAERNADETLSLSLAQQAEQQPRNGEDAFASLALIMEASRIENPPAEVQRTLAGILWQPGAVRRFSSFSSLTWDAAFTEDDQQVVTAAHDGSVILWDTSTGQEIRRFGANGEGHGKDVAVFTVTLSPDGQTAITGSQDKTLILWDLATGEALRTLNPGHNDVIWSATFALDGTAVLTASNESDPDNNLLLWDLETGAIIRRFSGHTGAVYATDLSPDGKLMVSGSFDGSVILWNLETGEILQRMEAHTKEVFGVAFTPDGQRIVSAGADTFLIIWDVATGTQLERVEGLPNIVRGLDVGPNNLIAVGLFDSNLLILDGTTGDELYRFQGHNSAIGSTNFTHDGKRLITTGLDGLILWDVVAPSAVVTTLAAGSPVEGIGLSGEQAVAALANGTLVIWDMTTGETVQTIEQADTTFKSLVVSQDGQEALTGSQTGEVVLWNLETGEAAQRMSGHTSPVRAVALSQDETLAASGAGNVVVDSGRELDNDVILWDVTTGEELRRFSGHTAPIQAVAFSPDGTLLASASDDTHIILWNVATGEEMSRLTGHSQAVYALAFSPDGKKLLSGGRDNLVILWDVNTHNTIYRMAGHTASVRAVAFSPDGQQALSGAGNLQTSAGVGDTSLILWDLTIGQEIRRFTGHTSPVRSVVFVGGQALSAGDDGQIILWQVNSFTDLIDWAYRTYDIFCTTAVGFGSNERCIPLTPTDDTSNATVIPAVPEQTADVMADQPNCLVENPTPLSSQPVETASFQQSAPYVIGYSSGGLASSADAYIAAWAQYEASQHADIEELIVMDAGGDYSQQITQLEELIAQPVNALIINPLERADMSAMQALITRAKDAGIPVILVNRHFESSDYVSFVGVDDFKLGCIMAQELIAALDAEGNIMRLNGIDATFSDRDRKAGNQAVLAVYPAITSVNEVASNLNEAEIRRVMQRIISENPLINGIWAYNGFVAQVALEEMTAANRPVEAVVGDQNTELSRLIMANDLRGAQVRVPSQMGAQAIQVALQILQGEPVESFIEVPVEVIPVEALADYDLSVPMLGDTVGLPEEFLPEHDRR